MGYRKFRVSPGYALFMKKKEVAIIYFTSGTFKTLLVQESLLLYQGLH